MLGGHWFLIQELAIRLRSTRHEHLVVVCQTSQVVIVLEAEGLGYWVHDLHRRQAAEGQLSFMLIIRIILLCWFTIVV